jgi:hypothetical protein
VLVLTGGDLPSLTIASFSLLLEVWAAKQTEGRNIQE